MYLMASYPCRQGTFLDTGGKCRKLWPAADCGCVHCCAGACFVAWLQEACSHGRRTISSLTYGCIACMRLGCRLQEWLMWLMLLIVAQCAVHA